MSNRVKNIAKMYELRLINQELVIAAKRAVVLLSDFPNMVDNVTLPMLKSAVSKAESK